jgi:AcrR family transcriptional regulator
MTAISTLQRGVSRSERNQREKLARIKRAARRLFGRKGFEATTTREIAAAADIGAGTLFLYAGTKEDLLVMIVREEVGREVAAAFAAMARRPLRDQLMQVFGAMIVHHERNVGLARVFVKELPFVQDRRHGVAAFMRDLLGRTAGLIEDAQRRGELRADVPAFALAQNLFALYFSYLQKWLGAEAMPREQRDASLHAALELHLNGLRTPRAARARYAASSNDCTARRSTRPRAGAAEPIL